MSGVRRTAALARQSGAWSPAVARHLLTTARRGRGAGARPSAGLPASPAHLEAAAGWLRRAQDATVDGGVSWGYRLNGGWAASYPETTGYIVPTYLALAEAGVGGGTGAADRAPGASGGPSDVDRARRAISFLLGIQLPSGAFPGARIDQNRTAPSVFNTGQILNGLVAWHRATDDPATADAAARAAAWLVSSQEPDGAWSRDVYNRLEVSVPRPRDLLARGVRRARGRRRGDGRRGPASRSPAPALRPGDRLVRRRRVQCRGPRGARAP